MVILIISGVLIHGKNFDGNNPKHFNSNFYDISVDTMVLLVTHQWGFGKILDGLMRLIHMVAFNRYWLGKRSHNDERKIKRSKGIVSR